MNAIRFAAPLVLALAAAPAYATGLATCASGSQDGWQPQGKLTADGGCYEVYALDNTGSA